MLDGPDGYEQPPPPNTGGRLLYYLTFGLVNTGDEYREAVSVAEEEDGLLDQSKAFVTTYTSETFDSATEFVSDVAREVLDLVYIYGGATIVMSARLVTHVIYSFVNTMMIQGAADVIRIPDPTVLIGGEFRVAPDWGASSNFVKRTVIAKDFYKGSAPTVTTTPISYGPNRWYKTNAVSITPETAFTPYKPFIPVHGGSL